VARRGRKGWTRAPVHQTQHHPPHARGRGGTRWGSSASQPPVEFRPGTHTEWGEKRLHGCPRAPPAPRLWRLRALPPSSGGLTKAQFGFCKTGDPPLLWKAMKKAQFGFLRNACATKRAESSTQHDGTTWDHAPRPPPPPPKSHR
jgi:hypothetical protein